MKPFVAIMDVTPDNRVAKYLDFDTEQEALDHVARFQHHDPVEYEGDGVTESFSIPWVIKSGKDVKITLRDAKGDILRESEVFPEDSTVNVPIIKIEKTETDENGEEDTTVEQTNVLQSGEFIKIERTLPVFPDAFVVEPPGPYLTALKVDKATKAVAVDVPPERIEMAVRSRADKLVSQAAPSDKINQMLARSARLNAEVGIKKRTLTQEEQAEVDQLIAVDDYTNAVRGEAERFIRDDLPNLTEDEKLNFDPATNPKLKWPAQP